ncbi:unnamed protein product [Orchesella dallaii]|uniref:Sodium-coupled monocarboxylate transporter 1 n=1 Tax=Orchesella dallaii TaxID=48710 RepID=A0ABP1QLL5_9HEXA
MDRLIAWRNSSAVGGADLPPFTWEEWSVFGVVLAISVGIGIFFGCFGSKNKSNEEYLLGGRRMNPIPVALSLLCSYVSSITLLGTPVEIYYYGSQLSMVLLAYIPLTLSLAFIYVPIYFQLQYTSIFEYLEERFHRYVRIFLSFVNIIYGIFFMSLVVYAPSLALELVIGIDYRIMVAVVFIVCIFYSSIGGFKAVLWTDSLQAVIMVVSMAVVVIVGTNNVGGVSEVWRRAENTDRINFFKFDVDPRTRHTFWTAVVGGYFQWLPMYANQAQIQRYVSLPNMRAVYIALLINLVGLFFLMGMTYFAGLVIFATYIDCDPRNSGRIQAADQILPLFVVETLQDYKGLPGLFVAGITCAGLSTVSSGVNALAASVVEDYVKKWWPGLPDSKLALVSKGISAISGVVAFGFVFIAESMGNIFSAATSLFGIFGGPSFGTFVCGMMFPQANTQGVTLGMIVSFGFMTFLGVGQTVYNNQGKLPVQSLSLNATCPEIEGSDYQSWDPAWVPWKEKGDDVVTQLFTISPLWYPCYGIILAIVSGFFFSLLASKVSKRNLNPPMNTKLFLPVALVFWKWAFPSEVYRLMKPSKEELDRDPKFWENWVAQSSSTNPLADSKTSLSLSNEGHYLNSKTPSIIESEKSIKEKN